MSPPLRSSPSPSSRAFPSLRGLRVLVTGSSGFIGRRVVARALAEGAHVTGLVRTGARPNGLSATSGLEIVTADVCDGQTLGRLIAIASPDIVLHLAAIADWRQDPTLTPKMTQTHVLGAAHLLEAARLASVGRVVLFGSAGEYGDHHGPLSEDRLEKPMDPYSASKVGATTLALTYHRSFGLACTVVRPFVVYGPGESGHRLVPSVFAKSRAGGGLVDFTTGHQRRDFIYVDDVAEGALRAALEPSAAGEVLNLGTGIATSVREMALAAIEVSGNNVIPRFGARQERIGEPRLLLADMEKTERLLRWRPRIVIANGLRTFWYGTADGET